MAKTANINNQILGWFNSDRDYLVGVGLLTQACKNKTLVRRFRPERASQGTWREKLEYELAKILYPRDPSRAGLKTYARVVTTPARSTAPSPETIPVRFNPRTGKEEPISKEEARRRKDQETFISSATKKLPQGAVPPKIQSLIKANGKLYTQRALLHKELSALGDANDRETKEKRVEILKKMEQIQAEADSNYQVIQTYQETGKLPKSLGDKIKSVVFKNEEKPPEKPTLDHEDPYGFKGMDSGELRRRLTNLRSVRTKKTKRAGMLPAGPKKEKTTAELEEVEKKIQAIEKILGIDR